MNTRFGSVATTVAMAFLALSGCTGGDDAAPAPSATPTVALANLSQLPVEPVSGKVPGSFPVWVPGDDAATYSRQTLVFLGAAARKADMKVPPLHTLTYQGDPKESVNCPDNWTRQHQRVAARDNFPSKYCALVNGKKGVVLVVPAANRWHQKTVSPWAPDSFYTPQSRLVESMAEHISRDRFGTVVANDLWTHCTVGELLKGVTLLQPELTSSVRQYLKLDEPKAPGPYDRYRQMGFNEGCAKEFAESANSTSQPPR